MDIKRRSREVAEAFENSSKDIMKRLTDTQQHLVAEMYSVICNLSEAYAGALQAASQEAAVQIFMTKTMPNTLMEKDMETVFDAIAAKQQ